MLDYLATWLPLRTDRRAVTALEYGLIAALIALAIIGAVAALGTDLAAIFTTITGSI